MFMREGVASVSALTRSAWEQTRTLNPARALAALTPPGVAAESFHQALTPHARAGAGALKPDAGMPALWQTK